MPPSGPYSYLYSTNAHGHAHAAMHMHVHTYTYAHTCINACTHTEGQPGDNSEAAAGDGISHLINDKQRLQ